MSLFIGVLADSIKIGRGPCIDQRITVVLQVAFDPIGINDPIIRLDVYSAFVVFDSLLADRVAISFSGGETAVKQHGLVTKPGPIQGEYDSCSGRDKTRAPIDHDF